MEVAVTQRFLVGHADDIFVPSTELWGKKEVRQWSCVRILLHSVIGYRRPTIDMQLEDKAWYSARPSQSFQKVVEPRNHHKLKSPSQ